MRKERKVNIIRALKDELDFYKRQNVKVNLIDRTELNHLRISSVLSRNEVAEMQKDVLSKLLIHRISMEFENSIMQMPIETYYDEHFGMYKATLDLWVKPNPMDRRVSE